MTDADPPRYVIEDDAAVDLQDAVLWYQTQHEGLGDALLLEFDQRLSAALEQPGIGTLAGHTRRGAPFVDTVCTGSADTRSYWR